jgi:hypothetical protein
MLSLEYDDGVIVPGFSGVSFNNSQSALNFNSGSTPDERGTLFVPSFNCKVMGFVTSITIGSGSLPVFDLMDDANNVLATVTLSNIHRTTGSYASYHHFDAEATLAAGQSYRIAMRPNSATNCTLTNLTQFPAGVKLAGFSSMQYTSRTNAGAWTEDATQIAYLIPLISAVDDGGGGGLLTHPGMS